MQTLISSLGFSPLDRIQQTVSKRAVKWVDLTLFTEKELPRIVGTKILEIQVNGGDSWRRLCLCAQGHGRTLEYLVRAYYDRGKQPVDIIRLIGNDRLKKLAMFNKMTGEDCIAVLKKPLLREKVMPDDMVTTIYKVEHLVAGAVYINASTHDKGFVPVISPFALAFMINMIKIDSNSSVLMCASSSNSLICYSMV